MVLALLLVGILVLVSETAAQVRVSEESFLAAVASDNRITAMLLEDVLAARAQRKRAGLLSNPETSFEREAPDGGAEQEIWSVAWSLPLDGRRGLRIREAGFRLQAAELDKEITHLVLRGELRAVFASWALSYERSELASRLAAIAGRLVGQMESRASRGEVSGLAARRLALASFEIGSEAAQAEAGAERNAATVRAWWPGLALDAVPDRPPLPPLPAGDWSPADRPQLEALRLGVEAAEARTRLENRFWAMPEFSFGWQRIRETPADMDGPVLGVSWPLPLFDRRQPERAEAAGRLAAARARHELAIARAGAEFAGARAAYARLRDAAAGSLDTGMQAERAIQSATSVFEAGEGDVTDLLETLRGALAGLDAALDLYAAALDAHRSLEIVAGRPLPLTEGETR